MYIYIYIVIIIIIIYVVSGGRDRVADARQEVLGAQYVEALHLGFKALLHRKMQVSRCPKKKRLHLYLTSICGGSPPRVKVNV